MKQEHSTDNAKQDAIQPAGCAGSVSMTDASAKSASDPNGVIAKQEQQNGPVPKSPQQSRAATPELKIERLDVRTGQVRCLHIYIAGLYCHLCLLGSWARPDDTGTPAWRACA